MSCIAINDLINHSDRVKKTLNFDGLLFHDGEFQF